jgi:hypothetical protein
MQVRPPKGPRRVLEWLAGRTGVPVAERVLAALTSAVVLLGLFLRARGYFWQVPAFWLDECTWAMNLVEQPLVELAIRPIGFMAVSRLLAQVFSLSEPVLRAMPWLAGLATLLMAPPLARRLFTSAAARLLFVFVIALHPCAIDFSKEFKPYSVSLALHFALMLTALRYHASGERKHLAWLLGVAVLGGPFAQDLVFAYPGVYLLVGWKAFRERREHLRPILVSAAIIMAVLLLQYLFIWRLFPAAETNQWGDKYNVFFTGGGEQSYGGWWLERQRDLAGFPGFRRRFWHPGLLSAEQLDQVLRPLDRAVWVILTLVGLVVIGLRRRAHALVLVVPLVMLALFNALRLWPLGVFRANVFAIVYTAGIACMAFELPARALAKLWDAVPALVLVFVPLALLDKGWSDHKEALTYSSEFPTAIRRLLEVKLGADPKTREPLLLDRRSCDPFRFYTQFHRSASRRIKRALKRQFEVRCIADDTRYRQALVAAVPREPGHAWTILHEAKPVTRMVNKGQLGETQVTYLERVGAHTLLAFWLPNAPPAAGKHKQAPVEDGPAEPEEPATGQF